ncbi:unnamed protein product [Mytilus coruscus]|uniref:BPTI/Kunitz inhibitor domain-containing protein n=1 Tax=Mytilus coruscus TaxID=42192 RepID=A0A6J8EI97_MYTCO|nr:unnamed protein product [Mytilus coruscus]
MPLLRQNERDIAVGMVQAGMRHIDVANNFGVSKLTITRLMSRLRQTGSSNDRPRSGRPRETTLRQDRRIRFTHLRDRFLPATITARQTPGRHNPRISAQTVRNRLRAAGLRSRRPVLRAILKQRHWTARLRWANALCKLEPVTGRCRQGSASFQRFYYNSKTGQCEQFIYGCGGNDNNFQSIAECQAACP